VTDVAFAATTVNVEELPAGTDVGLAEIVTVVAVAGTTVTVAVADALAPVPVALAV
jgi:hypothetical protein